MDDSQYDNRIFTAFEKKEEFTELQNQILFPEPSGRSPGEDAEAYGGIAMKISNILDEYLEQSYLVDSHLESLITPVVNQLKASASEARAGVTERNSEYTARVAFLLYLYVKFRGYKTITRFFPHEIADLEIALGFLLMPNGPASIPRYWSLRYIMLLWLSLICMLPFDLEQFDEHEHRGRTAANIESVAKAQLSKAGVERDAAAILLSRLYSRKDTVSKFPAFLLWSKDLIQSSTEVFSVMGCLRVLCEVTKSGSAYLVQDHLPAFLQVSLAVSEHKNLMSNTVIRKLRTKLVARVVLRLLPVRSRRSRKRGKILIGTTDEQEESLDNDEIDVPEETESTLEELFQGLQDKDTVVRYSAAKGIARIAERLPADFGEQILDNVLQLYSIHSIALARMYELPTVAEATWHGASIACAELARRGLIANHKLQEVLDWQGKALYFDIRQGSHSIGSSVRDAASYVIWSLAKAQSTDALAPFMVDLSQKLVTVSIYDREVHIRRAASAAFQECVGRTNLCPHGIPVLGKTDFYSVGLRRNAFLVAAPEVAGYEEYRTVLIDHVLGFTLRHWDPVMRQLGAQSLKEICHRDMSTLAPTIATRLAEYLTFPDSADVHGALLALTELASECRQDVHLEPLRRQIFSYLETIPPTTVLSHRHELITAAACNLIATSIALEDLESPSKGALPPWRKIIEFGLKNRGIAVQESAAEAIVDRQVLCIVYEYAITADTGTYDQSPTTLQNVEARRNAYASISQILENVVPRLSEHLTPAVVCEMIDSLQVGLEDYTTDERGDVGSWIRMVCIKGLADVSVILLANGQHIPALESYLPPAKFHTAIGGILKQGVERLDNVRQQAGQQLLRILELQLLNLPGKERWAVEGGSLMHRLFLNGEENIGWHEGTWLFPKAVQLLEIKEYRRQLLSGLVLSVSSRTDSTQRPVSTSLVNFAKSLPPRETADAGYSSQTLAEDLIAHCSQNLTANGIVIPVLQTFNVLLEGDAFEALHEHPSGSQSLRTLFSIASRNIPKVKNVQRISACMRILVNMLPMPALRPQCVAKLPEFLAHRYPKMRADTAEYLYLILQTKDLGIETDEAEDVILETEWHLADNRSSSDLATVREAAWRCAELLSEE
ncbi:hypothetical protein EIP91_002577 [Steccherinum ochraceum]|uniref:Uncharacterized protein n=1 Tax=Steccherinum ochraceum TaxID=92696 RepID=A0A4R0RFJ7_9APHY|nr:hypothetical protein EIP91_002577 [Steccherinum ochraceum]